MVMVTGARLVGWNILKLLISRDFNAQKSMEFAQNCKKSQQKKTHPVLGGWSVSAFTRKKIV